MEDTKKIPYSRLATLTLFIILTIIGLIFSLYLFFSVHSIYMYVIAACFAVLTLVSGFFNITTSYLYYRSFLYEEYLGQIKKNLKPIASYPTVAVAVPVYNEDPELIEKNLSRLTEMDYPKEKLKFYLLDDSTNEGIRQGLKSFSARHGITYIHREKRTGFKAGALNNMMAICKEDFVAIFDYDEYLTNTGFLKDTLPYFADDKLSYVQTEKMYAKGTFFSETVNLFDSFFFKFIQPARALNNTAIFAGSCGIIRSSYLRQIGGFPEYVIEDTFFSYESDSKGYKSLFIPEVYALGKPIKTFSELVQQQWRYNYGDNQFIYYILRRGDTHGKKRKFSALTKIDYMTHGFGLNYISVILLMFTVISIFIVFSQFSIANISFSTIFVGNNINWDLEILGISAFSLSVLTPVVLTKMHFKSISKGFMIFLLNFALVFVRVKAAFSALLNIDYKTPWEGRNVTGPGKKLSYALKNSFVEIFFSAALFVLSAFAFMVDNISGGFWLFWYSILYVSTFYMFYRYG